MEFAMFVVGVLLQFILEVAGAGGAVWGMSEVWKMRGMKAPPPMESNDRVRIPANIVFGLGAIRMFFRYAPDWGIKEALVDPHKWLARCGERAMAVKQGKAVGGLGDIFSLGISNNERDGTLPFELPFFVVGVLLQWILEVAGAGGAWWGMSEVWGIRGYGNADPEGSNDQLRYVSNIVFSIACVRMATRYIPEHAIKTALVDPHKYPLDSGSMASFQLECMTFVVGVFLQWILECAGAGGAWWGMSEVWGLRGYSQSDPEGTNDNLRPVSNVVFGISCIRLIQRYLEPNDINTAMVSPHEWVLDRMQCGASQPAQGSQQEFPM